MSQVFHQLNYFAIAQSKGFEPLTSGFGDQRSTTELRLQYCRDNPIQTDDLLDVSQMLSITKLYPYLLGILESNQSLKSQNLA